MEYFVYILECSDKSYYRGITNDIDRRLWEHNCSINFDSCTSSRLPVTLKFCESFNNPDSAIAFEKKLKGWSRRKKEALMGKEWEKLKEYSQRKTC